MALKFFILAALLAVSQASYLEPIYAPVTRTVVSPAPAHYDFGYSVDNPYDPHHQSRVESRRGDVVTGSYSVLDADGTTRIVDYNASPLTGFQANVRKLYNISPIPIVEKVY